MTETERQTAAREFAAYWSDHHDQDNSHGDETKHTEAFWLELLENVCGIEYPGRYIRFQVPVRLEKLDTSETNTGFIDGYIDKTLVLIELDSWKFSKKKRRLFRGTSVS